ncbi:hypothetical protein CHS0354_017647 [Potamilus streckersoni]|uniref:Uncharacterized protein n=1 Tax=Potamilus streckersoni TaxID=2493646 RepID=A0AAE0T2N6_9BIVA|nr:hypothetical protein CHS0354_017647 [Potamilus streckersoni]
MFYCCQFRHLHDYDCWQKNVQDLSSLRIVDKMTVCMKYETLQKLVNANDFILKYEGSACRMIDTTGSHMHTLLQKTADVRQADVKANCKQAWQTLQTELWKTAESFISGVKMGL